MSKRVFSKEHRRKLSESHMGNPGFWTGKKFNEEHLKNMSECKKGIHSSPKTEFKKGLVPWNKGLRGITANEKNGMWKGDNVGYYALHSFIKRKLGKPTLCSKCISFKNIQWANIDHKYSRNLSDWIQLCVPCHRKHDYKLLDNGA